VAFIVVVIMPQSKLTGFNVRSTR